MQEMDSMMQEMDDIDDYALKTNRSGREKLNIYMIVGDAVLAQIQSMNDNQRLPSPNALMKKYNVTRTNIERAISELIGSGHVYAKDGSGTYVATRHTGN